MEWTQEAIADAVEAQRAFFRTGATLDISWRRKQLKRLKQAMSTYEEELIDALAKDLGRSRAEAYFLSFQESCNSSCLTCLKNLRFPS